MRSAAIFQIISTLASMAILTLPSAQALPVRGALGSLGARARAAKRAAHYHAQQQQQHPIMAAAEVVDPAPASALPANNNDIGKRKRNKIKRSVTAASSPTAASTVHPIRRSLADGFAQIVADNVVAAIPILPQQNNAAVIAPSSSSSSSSASLETPAAVADAGAIYASYIAALGDSPATILPSSTTSTTSELDTAPTAFVVAAVQAVPVPSSSSASSSVLEAQEPAVDQQAIYQSYIAAMDQPTTGVWATATST